LRDVGPEEVSRLPKFCFDNFTCFGKFGCATSVDRKFAGLKRFQVL
jgi:hypothetical protein